jgi:hypothetical protein
MMAAPFSLKMRVTYSFSRLKFMTAMTTTTTASTAAAPSTAKGEAYSQNGLFFRNRRQVCRPEGCSFFIRMSTKYTSTTRMP